MSRHRSYALKQYFGSFLLLVFILTACTGTPGVSDEQAIENARLTLEAGLTQNAPQANQVQPQTEAQELAEPQAGATNTETPIPAALADAATATFTSTAAASNPTVSVTTATNCRSGPGAPYAINGSLSPGQTANVTAQASVNNYVLIKNPGGGPDCWLWLQYATITGDISTLPVVTPAPSPTPTLTVTPTLVPTQAFSWTGSWTAKVDYAAGASIINLALTQTGNTVSGTGSSWTINGTTSGPNNTILSGSYIFPIGGGGNCAGTFTWQVGVGTINQFRGVFISCVTGTPPIPMCGHRNGAGYPSPCLGP